VPDKTIALKKVWGQFVLGYIKNGETEMYDASCYALQTYDCKYLTEISFMCFSHSANWPTGARESYRIKLENNYNMYMECTPCAT